MYSGQIKIENVKCTLIVAAAGSGKRMGLSEKKQFLSYNGASLYMASVLVGEKIDEITKIVIVTHKEDVDRVKKECSSLNLKKEIVVVSGGKERQDSIENGLIHCEDGYIIVQDGARPFLKKRYILDAIKMLEEDKKIDGIVVGVKAKDTIKIIQIKSKEIKNTLERDTLFLAQTPQIFRSDKLKESYTVARKNGFLGTDDSSLVEANNGRIKILDGSYENIKITTIEDLDFLETLKKRYLKEE